MYTVSKWLILIVVLSLMAFDFPRSSQVIAYVDGDALLYELAVKNKVEVDLMLYKDSLEKELETMQAEFQAYYDSCIRRINQACMTPKGQMEMQERLQEKQTELQERAVLADQQLIDREEALLLPIRQRISDVITMIAKEKSYNYVLNNKYLLYGGGGISIGNDVRAELGLPLFSNEVPFRASTSTMTLAYVNKGQILSKMECYQTAKTAVIAYEESLRQELEKLQQEMEVFYTEYRGCMSSSGHGCYIGGKMYKDTDIDLELQKMQASIQKHAEEADLKLAKLETELLQPINEAFRAALSQAANENGYDYIIDQKQVLYYKGGIDAGAKIESLLGVDIKE